MPQELENLTFFIQTFGCQMNESDSERIAGILHRAGATKAARPEDGDIVIVNTCAVRKKAEEKFYSYIGRLTQIKKKKPVQIGIVGCVAQLRGLELLGKKHSVGFVLGPDNYGELPEILKKTMAEKHISTTWSPEWRETPPDLILRESSVSAYVPVMEGCNNFCAYCVVPFTRGQEKFRPLPFILGELNDLSSKGFKEIQLLGQNVNCYRDPKSGKSFTVLLKTASEVEGIEWIRFLTSHPKNFTAEIAQTMQESKKICRHLHLPLQSGSTSILKKMKRGYTQEKYLEKISYLRQLMPEISLSTDIIVGFPGETEKDFEETLAVLRNVRFANIFSFRYSPRPLTRASELEDDISQEEKRRRLEEVQKLQKEIQLENHRRQVGRVLKVLCLGPSKRTPYLYAGRNEGNQVVNFISPESCIGKFIDVRITGFGPYSLHGERTNAS
jgi:tRNA-2-methylthio-N6-dimethylallyladenosine synthase